MYVLSRRLVRTRQRIRSWCLRNKKHWGVNWKELNDHLHQAGTRVDNVDAGKEYIQKAGETMDIAGLKVQFWRQRMKELWVAKGDYPTPLLYSRVKVRQKRNKILTLAFGHDSQTGKSGGGGSSSTD